uniref:RNA-directed RNA polymerase n=1 Tax=Epizootic hemorrhagic disease virus 7 TaxID=238102 RepID=A0A810XKU7_9REOV|nr:VP1 protein [Epizootic hemorrhagic disease virus 7]
MVAITVQGAQLIKRVVERIYQGITFELDNGITEFYKFSEHIRRIREKHGVTYKRKAEEIEHNIKMRKEQLFGLPVLHDSTWEEIFNIDYKDDSVLQVYMNSVLRQEELDPEEEFLRNYKVQGEHAGLTQFIEQRAKNEMQIYGDIPIKVWAAFLIELDSEVNHQSLGVKVMSSFVKRYGEPFHQGFRDLSNLERFNVSYSTPLLFEMCCMESILEHNIIMRMKEEGIHNLEFGDEKIDPIALLRELFIICLPHPKKINNMLRSPYSWFVKLWGVGADQVTVLTSGAGDDRNSKDVFYDKYQTNANRYVDIFKCKFYTESQKSNSEKIEEAILYSQELGMHHYSLPVFQSMLRSVYTRPFYPFKQSNLMLASFLLSLQVITGYGRAWVKNVGTDFEKQMKPAPGNLIAEVSERTRENFIQAYNEAREKREEIVKPEDLYTSMLRLARNTSSGFAAEILIQKKFGPNKRKEFVKINSRIKAVVIFTRGHIVFTPTELEKKYDTTELYQTKGSRDVPIKATRTIYSINLSVLVPQLIVTLPLNEYFARVGGNTSPEYKKLGGKIIVGDLEATGSRVIDAADCFRNSGDKDILVIAIDYSEYDTHLTRYNFRKGMLEGIREAMKYYKDLRYEGYSLDQIIDFGYGEGRVAKTLWNGKRHVFRTTLDRYLSLSEAERTQGDFKTPKGVLPVTTIDVAKKIEVSDNFNTLVSATDGSDLALIDTHLSGENSTLIANSMHNKAIGSLIQSELQKEHMHDITFLSEQYVGDDTLFYCKLHTTDRTKVQKMITTIFDTVAKCGHEAAPSKTMITPYSVEKTQTHAKQGVYVPQDRMMIISSERRKDIEDVQGYVRSQVQTMVTKVSRGFCHDLAQMILMLKTTFIGAWKMKRTIKEGGTYRDRKFDSNEEDGFTLVMLKNPLALYVPIGWNGYGAHPAAINIVMTEEMFLDSMCIGKLDEIMAPISKIKGKIPPAWNETQADKRAIGSETKMAFFSKMARPAVQIALNNREIMDAVEHLPLGDFSPGRLSRTMMHSALLKESKARSLLAAGYELDYQKSINVWLEDQVTVAMREEPGVISTSYGKLFDLYFEEDIIEAPYMFPDQNLSPQFYIQKMKIGPRCSSRIRTSYVDKIDVILRKDVVMRGFITANTILNVIEKLGTNHTASDLTTVFTLMNIENKVAEELSEYITSEKIRFDALKLLKKGIAGDEFTMSLDIATQVMVDKYIKYPHQLTKTELDAVVLYCSQIVMLRAACGLPLKRMRLVVLDEAKRRFKVRAQRFRTHIPRIKVIKKLMDLNRMSVRRLENQFV